MPLKRLCDLALSAWRPWRAGSSAPRTAGTLPCTDDAKNRPAAQLSHADVPEHRAVPSVRTIVPVARRFSTRVEQIRERATEGWRDSTLTKEKREPMILSRAAVPSPISQGGVAGIRRRAVFCQEWRMRLPRFTAFDWCGHSASPGGLRRYQD